MRPDIQNVTEQKAAERHRLVVELQLRQAERMEALGRLAGGIAGHRYGGRHERGDPGAHLRAHLPSEGRARPDRTRARDRLRIGRASQGQGLRSLPSRARHHFQDVLQDKPQYSSRRRGRPAPFFAEPVPHLGLIPHRRGCALAAQPSAMSEAATAAQPRPTIWMRWSRSERTRRARRTVLAGYIEVSTATSDSNPRRLARR